MQEVFDISPTLSSQTAIFPGDTPFERQETLSIGSGDTIGLSFVKSTLHIGAHVDAPIHYVEDGETIEQRSLHYYFGPAQVIEVKVSLGQRIQLDDFLPIKIQAPRVLFKTSSFPDPNQWNQDFCSIHQDVIEFLAAQGALLVGIDTPSIDPWDSKTLDAHKKVAKHNMAILEGVELSKVKEGLYNLVCLPLKIKDGDASPVRAILIRE